PPAPPLLPGALRRSHRPHGQHEIHSALPSRNLYARGRHRTGRGHPGAPGLRLAEAHRCPWAYATVSVAMPKFFPALNVLTPRALFRAVAAWEVTVSLMLL